MANKVAGKGRNGSGEEGGVSGYEKGGGVSGYGKGGGVGVGKRVEWVWERGWSGFGKWDGVKVGKGGGVGVRASVC